MYTRTTVHLGNGVEGERRKAALQRLATDAGYPDNISGWLAALADEQIAKEASMKGLEIADFTNGDTIDFKRGYDAYAREIERVGRREARRNLIRLMSQHVTAVTGEPIGSGNHTRQVELAVNGFFARFRQSPLDRQELTNITPA